MSQSTDTLKEFSQGLAEAVRIGAQATVLVKARDGYAASGVVTVADRVLTANHVVEQDENITVMFPDGKTVAASLAGRDPDSDLALLRLAEKAPAAGMLSEHEHAVGQLVLALARPTDEGIQASLGVVGIAGGRYETGQGGFIEGVMRTDAAAYPGFAGGPLVDVEGRILGINTFGFRLGASLTIPVKRAGEIADRLEKEGTVKRGYLGIRTQIVDLPESVASARKLETGLLIVGVEKESAAEKGGLLVGDILIALDGTSTAAHADLLSMLRGLAAKSAQFELVRGGNIEQRTITIGQTASVDHSWSAGQSRHGRHHGRRR